MSVHRTLDGAWAECADSSCLLVFHFPESTVAEMAVLPLPALLPILEVLQPPTITYMDYMKKWLNRDEKLHRRYDLPAVIYPNGTMEWRQDGQLHRGDNKPAVVYFDGTEEWWHMGEQYRPGSAGDR